ncbi:MAG: hypothetical protein M3A44_05380 [Gammaproteobacteria bacterium]
MTVYSVDKLIAEARRLSAEYRKVTGRPLGGVSGEIAEHDAARLLELDLCDPKPGGYDAIGRGRRAGKRIQIKGRAIFDEGKAGQRIGQMKTDQEWDSVMLVLMDEDFEPYEIYEAEREDILQAIADSDASKRNKRGAMSVAKFKIISQLVWTRETGAEEGDAWDNQAVR